MDDLSGFEYERMLNIAYEVDERQLRAEQAEELKNRMANVQKKFGNIDSESRTFKRTAVDTDKSWEDSPASKKSTMDEKKPETAAERADREEELAPGERRSSEHEKDVTVPELSPGAQKETEQQVEKNGPCFTASKYI
ncbi:unnamed protein product [Caenorhabditis auriculariae]|uniref:Uncharacterized protein n=1 Tax=Caenorhabditis auriculariae TaxID=2777116 RepID=A0A8S1H6S3_9PELO|nr:unnamed protein product [Caenorhabditis auriculariae]